MEEKRIVRSSVFYQPVHSPQYILFRGLAHWILLVIREKHHIISLVAEVLIQKRGHVLHVIDAATQLPPLPEVVDANQEGLPPAGAVRVLESIALRRAAAEILKTRGRWRRSIMIALDVGVGTCRGHP